MVIAFFFVQIAHLRRQRSIPWTSHLSTKVEYKSSITTTAELIWLQHLFHTLKIKIGRRPLLRCDNKSAIHLVHSSVLHAQTKHIEITITLSEKKLPLMISNSNVCLHLNKLQFLLTKACGKDSFASFRHKLGIHPRSLPTLSRDLKNHEVSSINESNQDKSK